MKWQNVKEGNPISSIYSISNIGPILFITLIFFLTFVARVLISQLMPEIEESLGISHAQSGSLFLFMSMGYFFALIGSGYISAHIFHRNTIIVSALGVGLALCAISISTGFWGLIGSVFFLGFAAGLYLPSGITTLTDMVESNQWGKAISIHEIAPNLGFVAAPLIAEMMLIYFSWRVIPSLIGIFTICVGFLFIFCAKGGNFSGKPPGMESFRALFIRRDFWIMIMLVLTGLSTILMGILSGPRVVVFLVFIQGILATCYFPAGFAVLSSIGPSAYRNVAISFTIPIAFVFGGGVVPSIIGMTGDAGSFSAGVIMIGALITAGAALPYFIKLKEEG